jgi:membrane fusion protein (multidrug efflux system)
MLRLTTPLSLILASSLVITGCKRKAVEPSSATIEKSSVLILGQQDVARVVSQNLLSGVRIAGTLDPAIRIDVKAQISGQLTSLLGDRGTIVTQGQSLAMIDDPVGKAQVESIKEQLAAAERDLRSFELLFKAGATSERNLANARVTVENTKAQLAQAQQNVERGAIRSAINGIVSERVASAGEVVSPGQRLFSIVNVSNLVCDASVMPSDVSAIHTGQRAALTLSAFGNRVVEGTVERIDPVADPKTRRVGIHVRIPNDDGKLVAGLFATGVILTNEMRQASAVLLVPAVAVREQNGKKFVDAIESGQVVRKEVEVLPAAEAGFSEVRSGLKEGDLVISLPEADVPKGAKVQLVNPPK